MASSNMQHPLYAGLEYLKELNTEEDYWFGLESLSKLLENVKSNPLDERFRKFQVDDPFFNSRIGCLIGSEKLMLASGFLIDEMNGKEFYYMHATAEAWEELLTVTAILQGELQKSTTERRPPQRMASRERSIERVPSRDKSIERMALSRGGSKRTLPKSSSTHSRSMSSHNLGGEKKSKHSKHRRGSNGDSTQRSFNDSGESFFSDDPEPGMASESGYDSEQASNLTTKKKSKGKKKKKKKKKKKVSDKAHDEISTSGGYMGEGTSLAEGETKPKKKKKSAGKDGEKALSNKSGNNGSTSSMSSGSSLEDALGRSKGSLASGEEPAEKIEGTARTATKDFWKNANTQAVVASRMQNESSSRSKWGMVKNATLAAARLNRIGKLEGEGGDLSGNEGGEKLSFGKMLSSRVLGIGNLRGSDDEAEDDEDDEVRSTSTKKRRGIRIDAMHKVISSRRGLTDKTASLRSMGSSSAGRNTSSRPSRKLERAESRASVAESRVSMKDLERGLSQREIKELREMAEEKRQLREMRKKRLLEQIKRERGPRWSLLKLAVTIITAAELGLDLGTTIISFVSLLESFDCCGNVIDAGGLTLGVTIPYFILIVIELALLAFSVRHARANSARDRERMQRIEDENDDLEFFDDEDSLDSDFDEDEETKFHCSKVISWVLICNPFLGCLITWVLLYEVSSKDEAFLILFLEAGAVALMFTSLYLEREKLNFCTMSLHGIPLVSLW